MSIWASVNLTELHIVETSLFMSIPLNQPSLSFTYVSVAQEEASPSTQVLGTKPCSSGHFSLSHARPASDCSRMPWQTPFRTPVITCPVGCEDFNIVSLLLFLPHSNLFSTQRSDYLNTHVLACHPHPLLKPLSWCVIPPSRAFLLALNLSMTWPRLPPHLPHCLWAIPVGLLSLGHTKQSPHDQGACTCYPLCLACFPR